MSEIEFLRSLHVELVRHRGLRPEGHPHELFQTSTIEALLGGAFDGDVTLSEILQHGDRYRNSAGRTPTCRGDRA